MMKKQSAAEKLIDRVEWLALLFRAVALCLLCAGILLPAIGTWLWRNTLGYACFSLMGAGLLFALGYGYFLYILREYDRGQKAEVEDSV